MGKEQDKKSDEQSKEPDLDRFTYKEGEFEIFMPDGKRYEGPGSRPSNDKAPTEKK